MPASFVPGAARSATGVLATSVPHHANDLTVDHVTPLAAGGAPFDIANTAVLCRSCNSTKGASTDQGGDWDELISEAVGAEKYSRRLSERIAEGYSAKFDQERDPGGHAGLGFRRLPQPPHTLEIDPEAMAIVVGLFERYALGNVSATQLEAETGLAATRIRMILMNPLYNGWIRRHRGKNETRRPAPWRATPPVSDELWASVEEVRRTKTRGGDQRTGIASTCSAASSSASVVDVSATTARSLMAVTVSSTPSRVRHGVARLASAMRRGRALCSPRSPASRLMR